MTPVPEGLAGYLLLLAIAVIAHESWRWLGFAIGRNLDPDGEVFRWVRAVSTALVAGLCSRLALFPSGALETVPPVVRLLAYAGGILCFFVLGRTLMAAIGGGMALLIAGKLISG